MLGIGMGIGMFSSANAAAAQNAGANDPQHVICVRCKFCATVLAVNVPLNSMMEIVSVTCGHCTRLLSVDMSGAFDYFNAGSGHTASFTHNQSSSRASSSSLRSTTQFPIAAATELTEKSATTARGLADGGGGGAEKRQRVPSAYNQFIREEIQRIKAANPGISHKEAFSAAAKNWAHLGLMVSDDKKTETASSSASAPAATC